MSKYLCLNGDLLHSEEPSTLADNRALNYGDGVFETIRCQSSAPLYFENHFERLTSALKALKIILPPQYTENYFKFHINKLLQKNRIYKGARLRLTVYRKSGGLFTPSNNTAEYLMTSSPLENEEFKINNRGLNIGVYKEEAKIQNAYSGFKTCNSLFYVLAGLWKKENGYDDCLIINQDGRIVEGLSSNVFLVKNNILYTPGLESGCVDGTMRKTIIEQALKYGVGIKEVEGFREEELLLADEVFLTNAIQGVVFVAGFQERRYYHLVAKKIIKMLNKI